MWQYTAAAVVAVIGVVVLELRVLRTGLLKTRAYWVAMAICYGFMIAVNGWLTKLTAPIVLYDGDATTGWRFPWDIPLEDYLYGFALLTLAMLLWDAAAPKRRAAEVPGTDATVSSPPRETARGARS
ncbi:MAG TPA: lycopene cyclase domain-containing protein [Acidimicrobiia bacterium]|nr:lycopene cyclase domain-containing protein [Acidimicrobiia bacterium]